MALHRRAKLGGHTMLNETSQIPSFPTMVTAKLAPLLNTRTVPAVMSMFLGDTKG